MRKWKFAVLQIHMGFMAHLDASGDVITVQMPSEMLMQFVILHCQLCLNFSSFSLQAIEALETATKLKPVASLYMLLGKTQMKAKYFKDSVVSFDRALQLYVSKIEQSESVSNDCTLFQAVF